MYFNLSQLQLIGLAILGGLILVAIFAVAYWSHRLNLASRKEEEDASSSEEVHTFEDGLQEGHKPLPLGIIILIAGLLIWGVGYTLAHAFGVFYAQ